MTGEEELTDYKTGIMFRDLDILLALAQAFFDKDRKAFLVRELSARKLFFLTKPAIRLNRLRVMTGLVQKQGTRCGEVWFWQGASDVLELCERLLDTSFSEKMFLKHLKKFKFTERLTATSIRDRALLVNKVKELKNVKLQRAAKTAVSTEGEAQSSEGTGRGNGDAAPSKEGLVSV